MQQTWSSHIPIVTARLQLRHFRTTDSAQVHQYASDPEVTRYMSWGPNVESETEAFVTVAAEQALDSSTPDVQLAIVERASDELIGGCGLISRRSQYREYEVGYCLARRAWGNGYGTEAIRALVAFGFGRMNAHRIYALADPDNATSRHLLIKVGFRLEGHIRHDTLKQDAWRDSFVYGLLADEWPSELS